MASISGRLEKAEADAKSNWEEHDKRDKKKDEWKEERFNVFMLEEHLM